MASSNSLEAIPPELKCHILKLCSRATLFSLIRASPNYLHVYLLEKEAILSFIALSNIPAGALKAAIAVGSAKCSMIDFTKGSAAATFMKSYRSSSTPATISVNVAVQLLKLQSTVELWARSMIPWAAGILRDFVSKAEKSQDVIESMDFQYEDLSDIERSRTHRGIYNHILFTTLFPKNQDAFDVNLHNQLRLPHRRVVLEDLDELDSQDVCDAFLYLLPAWEVEELGTFREYLCAKFYISRQRAEDDIYIDMSLAAKEKDMPYMYSNPTTEPYRYSDLWTTFNHLSREGAARDMGVLMRLLHLDLSDYQRFLNLRGEAFFDYVEEEKIYGWNTEPQYEEVFETVPSYSLTPEHKAELQAHKAEPLIEYQGDYIECGNRGWLWGVGAEAGNELYHTPTGTNELDHLRRCGYALWDESRLLCSGILDVPWRPKHPNPWSNFLRGFFPATATTDYSSSMEMLEPLEPASLEERMRPVLTTAYKQFLAWSALRAVEARLTQTKGDEYATAIGETLTALIAVHETTIYGNDEPINSQNHRYGLTPVGMRGLRNSVPDRGPTDRCFFYEVDQARGFDDTFY